MKERINSNPSISFKACLFLQDQKNKAADIVQKIFFANGWSNSWRNGINNFHHYHNNTHECLGISMGASNVIPGGPNGERLKLSKGDLVILPAGVGYKCTYVSEDFQCIGAYPQGADYNINYGMAAEMKKNLNHIDQLSIPAKDPVFGKQGFLKSFWKHPAPEQKN